MRLIERRSARWVLGRRHWTAGNVVALFDVAALLLTTRSISVAQSARDTAGTPDTASKIIQRMVQRNELRAEHLKYFTSVRHYHVEFHGLGQSKTADMHVQATFTAGSGKSFQVIDESGSHLLLTHVLKKLLETEQNDSREQKAALTPSNYNFEFQTKTSENGRELYVFAVEPKVKNKLLYRGKIWIDAGDYAVIKVEAQPAETPSFWIKKTEIHHVYAKSGEFWLPETNRSESKVRLGGSAVLTIDYGTYQFEKPHESTLTGAAEVASHKPPPDVQ
jgi:hypothetical protein